MHSSQMYTVGPAINFLTSFWLLPQKEQLKLLPLSGPFALILHAVRRGLSLKRMRKRAYDLGLVWHSPYVNGFAEKYLSQRETSPA